jgi:hypothetical protein
MACKPGLRNKPMSRNNPNTFNAYNQIEKKA